MRVKSGTSHTERKKDECKDGKLMTASNDVDAAVMEREKWLFRK